MTIKKYFKKPKFIIIGFAVFSLFTMIAAYVLLSNKTKLELEANITDGKFDSSERTAIFEGKKISVPTLAEVNDASLSQVLSATTEDEKWIEIDLTNQRLRTWQGNRLIDEFLVSTGKRQWGTATPPGVYRIWIKLRYTKMSGGSGSTYYYLPNVQCTQYFYKGYGIHGTYWHDNFGHPMSHGCVNMRNEDACKVFYWTSPPITPEQSVARPTNEFPGTRVVVHGETPWE